MYLRVYVHIHWFADVEEYFCLCAPVFHYPVCSNAGVHDRTCIHIGTHIWSYLISFVYVYIPAVFHHHRNEISKHLIVCNKWTYRTKCLSLLLKICLYHEVNSSPEQKITHWGPKLLQHSKNLCDLLLHLTSFRFLKYIKEQNDLRSKDRRRRQRKDRWLGLFLFSNIQRNYIWL